MLGNVSGSHQVLTSLRIRVSTFTYIAWPKVCGHFMCITLLLVTSFHLKLAGITLFRQCHFQKRKQVIISLRNKKTVRNKANFRQILLLNWHDWVNLLILKFSHYVVAFWVFPLMSPPASVQQKLHNHISESSKATVWKHTYMNEWWLISSKATEKAAHLCFVPVSSYIYTLGPAGIKHMDLFFVESFAVNIFLMCKKKDLAAKYA